MHTGSVSRALAILAMAPVALWLGCGGGSDLTGPPVGSLEITTATTGLGARPGRLRISIDGGAVEAIGANTSRVVEGLSVGAHAVDLSGRGGELRLVGRRAARRADHGQRGDRGELRGDVRPDHRRHRHHDDDHRLADRPGRLRRGAGRRRDPADRDRGHGDAARASRPAPTRSRSADWPPTARWPATIRAAWTVSAGATAAVAIAVTCAPPTPPPAPGGIGVTTQTSGPDQDADGYAVTRRRWRRPADRHRRHAGARRSGARPAFGGAHRHQRQLPGRRRQPAGGGRRLRHRRLADVSGHLRRAAAVDRLAGADHRHDRRQPGPRRLRLRRGRGRRAADRRSTRLSPWRA